VIDVEAGEAGLYVPEEKDLLLFTGKGVVDDKLPELVDGLPDQL